eukprot:scaffold33420_cov36-Tisochrysis_lutea.AAC.2
MEDVARHLLGVSHHASAVRALRGATAKADEGLCLNEQRCRCLADQKATKPRPQGARRPGGRLHPFRVAGGGGSPRARPSQEPIGKAQGATSAT